MGTVTVAAKGTTGCRKVNLRMTATLRFLLLFTFLVTCHSAPKFHLIETEDEGEDGGLDEVGSNQEGEGEEGGADQLGSNQEDQLEDGDYNSSKCKRLCDFFNPQPCPCV